MKWDVERFQALRREESKKAEIRDLAWMQVLTCLGKHGSEGISPMSQGIAGGALLETHDFLPGA